jgi:chemotaxis protein MotC
VSLLDSALAMAGQIRTMPGMVVDQTKEAKPVVTKVAENQPAQGLEQLQSLSKARDALSRVDKLIKK